MAISIKTPEEIEKMRVAGRLAAEVLEMIEPFVKPGEIVTITKDGIRSDKSMCLPDAKKQARCVFEYIYFARPDSVFDGVSVYHSRLHAGRCLAIDSPVDADIVVGVPESGNAAALGYSMESGIPYGTAFVKNSYVGRTFIKPKQNSFGSCMSL